MTALTRRSLLRLSALCAAALCARTLTAQDWAKARLEASPRHHEYVSIQSGGTRTMQVFMVYPEAKGKAPVILLIHEIFGLTDWAKEMADELAAKGYIVAAPDLLSSTVRGARDTSSFSSQEEAVQAVSALNPLQVNYDLNATADYALKLPAAENKLAVAGFCWGGGKSFNFATQRPDLKAAFVFYGPPPPDDSLKAIHAPVYGFYAGNDARISSTVPATTAAMKAAGKIYDPTLYDGAGHGFMRAGEAPDASPANKKARDEGLAKMITKLGEITHVKAQQ